MGCCGEIPKRPAYVEGHWAGAMLMLLSALELRVSVRAEPVHVHRIPPPCKTMQRDHPLKQHLLPLAARVGVPDLSHPILCCKTIAIHATRTIIPSKEDSALQVALFFLSGRFRLQRYGRTYKSTLAVSVWAIRPGHRTAPLPHGYV